MASFARKLKKFRQDHIGYCLDSKHTILQAIGRSRLQRQTARFEALGAAAADQKITVIMTAYNTAEHVGGAIQSVLKQSHRNLELMIIDDASTDATLDVLRKFAVQDDRIKVFSSSKNHGTYWSKNWCLRQAENPFVAFHDSDDVSHPKRLQVQLGALLDGHGADAVTCHWNRVNSEGAEQLVNGARSRLAAISLMIRRAPVLETAGYFDCVRIAADSEYLARLQRVLPKGRVRRIRPVLYTGLLREGSLTRGEGSGVCWENSGASQQKRLVGDRATYHTLYEAWHREQTQKGESLFMPYPPEKRLFEAPESIIRGSSDPDIGSVRQIAAQETVDVQ